MRVALVCPYDLTAPGGVQSHVAHLAAALTAGGDEVVVIGPRGDAVADVRDGAEHVGVGGSRRVPFNDSVAPVALHPSAIARTRRAVASTGADVVHVHEPMVPWVGPVAVWSSSAPVVATFHAWSDRDRAYRLSRPLARRLVRRLAAAVAVSEPAAAYHAHALRWRGRHLRVVPNGVEADRFETARPWPGITEDAAPTLLFVGRLERRKGLEVLVRAFTRLKADRPDVRLHVVGEGPELERCRSLLPARLRDDVAFHGRVSAEDVPRWFASCDVYVSPALGGESFGIVLLEAMAAGRPVVASSIPGYRSVATDGLQGRLVSPGDAAALAQAIGALLDNPALRSAMGQQGRRTARAHDWPRIAERLRGIYAEAVRG